MNEEDAGNKKTSKSAGIGCVVVDDNREASHVVEDDEESSAATEGDRLARHVGIDMEELHGFVFDGSEEKVAGDSVHGLTQDTFGATFHGLFDKGAHMGPKEAEAEATQCDAGSQVAGTG